MKLGRSRSLRSVICVSALTLGAVMLGASPASAACGSTPGTNPITVKPEPPLADPGIVVPGVPGGLVTVCADVEGDPIPQVDFAPTVDVQPTGCGIPCFVVEWDGVTINAVTVSGSVNDVGFERTVPAGSYGGFCVNSGQTCPE